MQHGFIRKGVQLGDVQRQFVDTNRDAVVGREAPCGAVYNGVCRPDVLFVWILIEVVDSIGVEQRSAPLDPVDLVAF